MKQHIAKLLVFLMLMTTMIVPADLSFAESGNENTTQTEESNAPQMCIRDSSSNVTKLHEQFFGQEGYTPTQDVQNISKRISAKTGLY